MIYQQLELHIDYSALGLPNPQQAPTLTAYCASVSPEINASPRPALLLCPGGGYAMTSDREAEPIALALVARGIQVFVLRYAVNPDRYPTALVQVAHSLALIRDQASTFNVDPGRIGIGGFSAGGHLACSLGVFWNDLVLAELPGLTPERFRPDYMLLCYPVISSGPHRHDSSFRLLLGERHKELVERMSLEKQVHEDVPPAFIWHTAADPAVPVENALLLALALKEKQVPFEMHVYDRGGHGLSLGNELTMSPEGYAYEEAVQGWLELFVSWLKRQELN